MNTNHIPRLAAVLALAALGACRAAPAADLGPTRTLAESGAGNPTVAADAARGATYVAWVQTADSASDVYLARLGAGGKPEGEPVRVNSVPGDASTHEQAPPQVVAGPSGEIYVVWQKSREVEGRRFPATNLRFARSTDGGKSFEPAVFVNDDADGLPASHTFHDVAVAKDGTIVVSWLDSRERERYQAEHGGAKPAAGKAAAGAMGGHGGHGGHGADAEGPGSELRVARSTDGGRSFGPSVVVDRNVCPCCRTSLALAPDGGVYLVWRKVFAGSVRDVAIAHSADGGQSFSAPERVHADGWVFGGCPHAGPSVAVDATGRVHVAWYTGKEGRQGLWYASSTDGTHFGAPTALLTGEWVPPSQVKLSAAGGEVWVAWDDRREDTSSVHLARIEGGAPREVGAAVAGRLPEVAGAAGALAWADEGAVRVRVR